MADELGEVEDEAELGMLSAAKIFARWDEERATIDKPSHIVARTRGIPSGIAFTAQLECVDVGPAGSVEGMTSDDELRIPVEDWDDIESVPFAGEIEADAPFPAVFFGATLVGAGRQIRIPNPIRYQDELTMQLVLETEDGPIPLDNERYVIATRWGRRLGTTDETGNLVEQGLPPGGANLAIRGRHLAEQGVLAPGWDLDA